ncbi:hypothetical protein HPP92_011966 [Vanilla planifolia]|uniref:DUF4408 domain-containing protein n=1 Tax=Vanilla planifolia TaxID=51239 RepID=A0A835RDD9_VANPL|nr:hypothetical protein HPP92_011966 [Vanilla planifolia]
MGGRVISLTILAASAAVLSVAVVLRLATPDLVVSLTSEASRVYGSVSSCLTPLYLYLIINSIIISIAATSHFQKPVDASSSHSVPDPSLSILPPPISAEDDLPFLSKHIPRVAGEDDLPPELISSAARENETTIADLAAAVAEPPQEEEFIISRSSWTPRRRASSEAFSPKTDGNFPSEEKPLVSTRLGRRKSTKFSPEGKALRVARPRKHETLESTWRTITDGRAVPLARHLKKSDTWDHHARTTGDPAATPPALRKPGTLAARPSCMPGSPSPSSGECSSSATKLRRQPSLGQDDLHRRVEAFIKKVNDDMRLQRQQSLQKYMEMINRGTH